MSSASSAARNRAALLLNYNICLAYVNIDTIT
jgi:hypothetical protein